MNEENAQDRPSITEEAEAAAREERERLFQAQSAAVFDQSELVTPLAESLARTGGFEEGKLTEELITKLDDLREQVVNQTPPPLEETTRQEDSKPK
jgi:hypothetical protein